MMPPATNLPSPGKDPFHSVPSVPSPGRDAFHSVPNVHSVPTPDPAIAPQPLSVQELEISQQLYAAVRQRLLFVAAGVAHKGAFLEVARFADLASRLARR